MLHLSCMMTYANMVGVQIYACRAEEFLIYGILERVGFLLESV